MSCVAEAPYLSKKKLSFSIAFLDDLALDRAAVFLFVDLVRSAAREERLDPYTSAARIHVAARRVPGLLAQLEEHGHLRRRADGGLVLKGARIV